MAPIPRNRGTNWSRPEDLALIRAWLNTARDPETDQTAETFWERVRLNYLAAYKEHNDNREASDRGRKSNIARFAAIQAACLKLQGYLQEAETTKGNDETDADVDIRARCLYSNGEGRPFMFDHCWLLLKDAPKWQETCKRRARVSINAHRRSSGSPARVTPAAQEKRPAPSAVDNMLALSPSTRERAAKKAMRDVFETLLKQNETLIERASEISATRCKLFAEDDMNRFYLGLPADDPDRIKFIDQKKKQYAAEKQLEESESNR